MCLLNIWLFSFQFVLIDTVLLCVCFCICDLSYLYYGKNSFQWNHWVRYGMKGQDIKSFPLFINAACMGAKQTLHLRNERFIWMTRFINLSELLNIFIPEGTTRDLMFSLILFHVIMFIMCCASPLEHHKLLSVN